MLNEVLFATVPVRLVLLTLPVLHLVHIHPRVAAASARSLQFLVVVVITPIHVAEGVGVFMDVIHLAVDVPDHLRVQFQPTDQHCRAVIPVVAMDVRDLGRGPGPIVWIHGLAVPVGQQAALADMHHLFGGEVGVIDVTDGVRIPPTVNLPLVPAVPIVVDETILIPLTFFVQSC